MSNNCSNPNILVFIAASLAAAISEEESLENINILSEFFSALGDNLALIAAQKEAREKDMASSTSNNIR